MLALHLDFLAGRFTASSFNDRSRGEWPPHPARVFSALVDALYDVDELHPAEASAIDGLAEAGAPWIVASEARPRRVVTHYVPVNDASVCEQSTLTTREAALHAAEEALEHAHDVTAKQRAALAKKVSKARTALTAEARKRAKHHGKFPAKPTAPPSLPWERVKQPRTFPTMLPTHPRVSYVFDTEAVDASALNSVLSRVTRVGHSSSPVAAHIEQVGAVASDAGREVWHPNPGRASADSRQLRVPLPDQRARLDELVQKEANKSGRTMPYQVITYGRGPQIAVHGHTDRSHGRWLSFAFEADPGRTAARRPPASAVVAYTEALRNALAQRANGSPALTGKEGGKPAQRAHAAFLGLPFVGHQHADGLLRSLTMLLPNDTPEEELAPIWSALAAWEQESLDADGTRVLRVPLGQQVFRLRRIVDPAVELKTVRPERWSAPVATTWHTVTPIALGGSCPPFRHPKPAEGSAARRKAVRLIQKAAARTVVAPAGHTLQPEDVLVELSFSPIVPGSPNTARFPKYQRPGHPHPRRLVHATLRFPFPLRGPLVLGSGRHLGLGLCLPTGAY